MSENQETLSPQAIVELLHAAVTKQLSEMTGAAWTNSEVPSELPEDSEYDFRANAVLSGGLTGELQLHVAAPYMLRLLSAVTARPCDDVGDAELEALRAFMQGLVTAFCQQEASIYGEVSAAVTLSSSPIAAAEPLDMTLSDSSDEQVNIRVSFSPALINSLERKVDDTQQADVESDDALVAAEPDASSEEGAVPESGSIGAQAEQVSSRPVKPIALSADGEALNLDLVLDVELSVTLRFGQRQLSLREVLELTSGSVVELDRQVEEPVELLLDGRVIARGEAVVIDGNYGLRVIEVPNEISTVTLR